MPQVSMESKISQVVFRKHITWYNIAMAGARKIMNHQNVMSPFLQHLIFHLLILLNDESNIAAKLIH